MAEQVVASGPEGELMTVDWRSDDWSGGPAALHGMVGAAWRAGLACLAVGLLGCSVGRVPLAESEATVEDGAGVEKGRLGDGEGSTAGGKLPWRQALSEWRLAPGSQAAAGGRELSLAGFDDSGWLEAAVPGTVVGAQVAAGELGDPLYGGNLAHLPGWVPNFLPMPPGSPYRESWWWRTEFSLPDGALPEAGWLSFEGLNYAADIWLNGELVASREEAAGAFRELHFEVGELLKLAGGKNALAVELTAPDPLTDLAIYWVDWNPAPPDRNMGLWMPVTVAATGPVAVRHPAVLSRLTEAGAAELTLVAELVNGSGRAVTADFRAEWDGRTVRREVVLAGGERRELALTSADHPELLMATPLLWWPYQYGTPHLYRMELSVRVDGGLSDESEFAFGLREVTATLNEHGGLLYSINGRPILIRGAGWAPDIFLRHDPVRKGHELDYVKEMGLNAIRLEGKLEDHSFYDWCDREGILLIAGWCCCDMWERWDDWQHDHHELARASLADQLRRLRRHASVLTWLNGSDFHPPPEVEQSYLEVAAEARWNLPIVSSATETPSTVTGPSGMKMTGPYHWVPPNYWYLAVPAEPGELAGRVDWEWLYGGAYGFNSESSPGPSIPPLESLLRMMDEKDLWPPGEVFYFHSGNDPKQRLRVYLEGMEARYGEPADLADFAFKSQVMAYEAHRAMFEAQGRNKYFATGHIQWMLNNAWPGMIWHLYDWFLRPGGAYFGVREALRPWHVQLSYDDLTVWVVNSTLEEGEVQVEATLVGLDSEVVATQGMTLAEPVAADGRVEALALGPLLELHREALTPVWFVELQLRDLGGDQLDRNFYWMPAEQDSYSMVPTADNLPAVALAEMGALNELPAATVECHLSEIGEDFDGRPGVWVTLVNRGPTLAFFVELLLLPAGGDEPLLPVFWSDNFVSLLPGAEMELSARIPPEQLPPSGLAVRVAGWNVPTGLCTGR